MHHNYQIAYLGAIILDHGSRKVLDRLAFVKDLGDSELAPLDFRCCSTAGDLIVRLSQEHSKSRTIILCRVGRHAPVYRRLTRVSSNIKSTRKARDSSVTASDQIESMYGRIVSCIDDVCKQVNSS